MNKEEALELVKSSGYELENFSDEFKKDKEIVLIMNFHQDRFS